MGRHEPLNSHAVVGLPSRFFDMVLDGDIASFGNQAGTQRLMNRRPQGIDFVKQTCEWTAAVESVTHCRIPSP